MLSNFYQKSFYHNKTLKFIKKINSCHKNFLISNPKWFQELDLIIIKVLEYCKQECKKKVFSCLLWGLKSFFCWLSTNNILSETKLLSIVESPLFKKELTHGKPTLTKLELFYECLLNQLYSLLVRQDFISNGFLLWDNRLTIRKNWWYVSSCWLTCVGRGLGEV
jgi:hypothetical protein